MLPWRPRVAETTLHSGLTLPRLEAPLVEVAVPTRHVVDASRTEPRKAPLASEAAHVGDGRVADDAVDAVARVEARHDGERA